MGWMARIRLTGVDYNPTDEIERVLKWTPHEKGMTWR